MLADLLHQHHVGVCLNDLTSNQNMKYINQLASILTTHCTNLNDLYVILSYLFCLVLLQKHMFPTGFA